MATTVSSFDPSILLGFYQSQLTSSSLSSSSAANAAAATAANAQANSATAADNPPWEDFNPPTQQVEDAQVVQASRTFIDTSECPA